MADASKSAREVVMEIESRRRQPVTGPQRKRRRRQTAAERNKRKIFLGCQWERWIQLAVTVGAQSDEALSEILLDVYYAKTQDQQMELTVTSTPIKGPGGRQPVTQEPDVSEISSAEESVKSAESCMEPVGAWHGHGPIQPRVIPEKRGSRAAKVLGASFVNPLEVSFEVSEEDVPADDQADPNYTPPCGVNMCPNEYKDLKEISFEEIALGEPEGGEYFHQLPEVDPPPGVYRATEVDAPALSEAKTCLVYLDQLLLLGKSVRISSVCQVKGCRKEVTLTHWSRGSAVHLEWVCGNRHIAFRWSSQPLLNFQVNAGDLLIAAAVLLSGNNFLKVRLFAKFLNMAFLDSCVFYRMQANYLLPAIEEFWAAHVQDLRANLQGKDLVLLGDGRMDSPGHSAQYCTYSFIEKESKQVLSICTVDKRETDRKSPVMEKEGFNRALAEVEQTCNVVEVVTDAHVQITAQMRKEHPDKKHSYDVWHGAKNIGKKIIEAARQKSARELIPWVSPIVNHFWFTCRHAETLMRFRGIWCGMLHHVVDQHSWLLSYDQGPGECSHGALMVEHHRPWLQKGSPALKALRDIVMSKYLLRNIPYYLNFRTTSELENFNQLILMYASKRFSYTPPVYRARCKLAALDHNFSVDRPAKTDVHGNKQFNRVYNKKSQRWSAVEVKVPKTYAHINKLKAKIFLKRLSSREGMHKPVPLSPSDPRQISSHLAPKSPPSTMEIVAQQQSRFVKKDEGVSSLSPGK